MLERIITKEGYELLTLPEAAESIGVHIQSVYKWIRDGRLEPIARIGNYPMVDKTELQEAADSYRETKPRKGRK